jgi:hypothetical protein
MQEHQIKNEKGDLIEFKTHRFLYDIYRDDSPFIVVMKAAQIGASTMQIVKNFYNAYQQKIDQIYTLPTDKDVQVFVSGKVNRIISQNPILQQWTNDKDTIEQKQIGNSMIYFRGTWTEKAAIMVTADRLVHDEIDSSKQDVINDYQSRLQHSRRREVHVFSHPSAPDMGVDTFWKQSDMKHWFIICPHCKNEFTMDWPSCVDMDKREFVCPSCHGNIDDKTRMNGRWKARFAGKKYSGYHVPLLICPWVTAGELIDKYNDEKTTEEFFYNKVLGKPYIGSGNSVSERDILKNVTDRVNEQTGTIIIGVDSGIDLRFVVGNKEGIFFYGQKKYWQPDPEMGIPLEDTMEYFLKRYPRAIMVIDQGGDIVGPRKLQQKYPGKVFLAFYRKDRKTRELVSWGQAEEHGKVIIDRNALINLLIGEFKDGMIVLNGKEADWWEYWLHWSHIYRTQKINHLGMAEWRWERSNRDDWVHATVYFRTGLMKFAGGGSVLDMGDSKKLPSLHINPYNQATLPTPYTPPEDDEDEWRT